MRDFGVLDSKGLSVKVRDLLLWPVISYRYNIARLRQVLHAHQDVHIISVSILTVRNSTVCNKILTVVLACILLLCSWRYIDLNRLY